MSGLSKMVNKYTTTRVNMIATWTVSLSRLFHSLRPLHVHIYLDRNTVLTVSQSQPLHITRVAPWGPDRRK